MVSSDARYKRFFSNPRVFASLLKHFVNEDFIQNLDLHTLKLMDKQFVDKSFQKRESDLLYQVSYMGKLPAVFPLLLYNGENPWTAALDTADLIDRGDVPIEHIPRFRYYIIAINALNDEILQKMRDIVDAALYFEKRKNFEGLDDEVKKLLNLFREQEPRLWKELAGFIGGAFSNQGELDIALDHMREDGSVIETVIKQRDAFMKQEGKQEGRQEGIIQVAKGLKQSGVCTEIISRNTGLTPEEIDKL